MGNISGGFVFLMALLTAFNYVFHAEGGMNADVNYADIKGVFKRCTACHYSGAAAWVVKGLLLDSFDSIRDGGITKITVRPGKPDDSWLVNRIEHHTNKYPRMPLIGKPLTKTEIGKIRTWIAQGAKPGPDTIREPKIEISKFQINRSDPLHVYCLPSDPLGALLRIRVFDPVTGKVLDSYWNGTSDVRWASWLLGKGSDTGFLGSSIHRNEWPDEIGIKLSIRSKGFSFGDGTIFIVSNTSRNTRELEEIVGGEGYMEPTVVQPPMNKSVKFYVSLPWLSHVLLKIWKEADTPQPVIYERTEAFLQSGENVIYWDLKARNGRYITTGSYTANFALKPVEEDSDSTLQILVLFSVRYVTDWE